MKDAVDIKIAVKAFLPLAICAKTQVRSIGKTFNITEKGNPKIIGQITINGSHLFLAIQADALGKAL
jgi:hypothetical protein